MNACTYVCMYKCYEFHDYADKSKVDTYSNIN